MDATATNADANAAADHPRRPLCTLLIDNYDSYTFNIYQYLAQLNLADGGSRGDVVVIRNHDMTWKQLEPLLEEFDNVVISPGPGRPDVPEDFGVCADVIAHARLPVLGVCLGLQGMAIAFGGKVVNAPVVMHGRLSKIRLTDAAAQASPHLFHGLPAEFDVVRYHSLVAEAETLPECLRVTAVAPDGTIMALEHVSRPFYATQFHPESICTEHGFTMLENFASLTRAWWAKQPQSIRAHIPRPLSSSTRVLTVIAHQQAVAASRPETIPAASQRWHLHATQLPGLLRKISSQEIFLELYGRMAEASWHPESPTDDTATPVFWLDSSKHEPELSRFSFMGAGDGPLSFIIEYDVQSRTIHRRASSQSTGSNQTVGIPRTAENPTNFFARMEAHTEFIKQHISRATVSFPAAATTSTSGDGHEAAMKLLDAALPFDFWAGFVGYFGYELRSESGVFAQAAKPVPSEKRLKLPDAWFLFADRFLALDHDEGDVFLIEIVGTEASSDVSQSSSSLTPSWTTAALERLQALTSSSSSSSSSSPASSNSTPSGFQRPPIAPAPVFHLERTRSEYLSNVEECQRFLTAGESYELCLTTRLFTPTVHPSPLHLYLDLRATNPALNAAFLLMAPNQAVVCSSPERFLVVSRSGWAESKPIKGTTPRGRSPEEDERLRSALGKNEKDFAENLMIVDLIRNDLGIVCQPGTVSVPKLMQVETSATVHSLVSTIRGKLCGDMTAFDAIQSCFPPGSMTGAPKVRSMDILNDIEVSARGVYSGTLGFLSVNGSANLNVVIRTIMLSDGGMQLGAGGAIVALSDPQDEYDEMLLKIRAPVASILRSLGLSVEQLTVDNLDDSEIAMLKTSPKR